MRNVVLYMSMALVGSSTVIEATLAWRSPRTTSSSSESSTASAKAGADLMGRVAYLQMASHWPRSDDAYAAPKNAIPKRAFSHTFAKAR